MRGNAGTEGDKWLTGAWSCPVERGEAGAQILLFARRFVRVPGLTGGGMVVCGAKSLILESAASCQLAKSERKQSTTYVTVRDLPPRRTSNVEPSRVETPFRRSTSRTPSIFSYHNYS